MKLNQRILQLDETFYNKHITFTSVPLVTELTQPLTKIGLSYFTFDRTYEDESHLRLTNAGKWIESYYRKELFKAAIFEKDPRLFCNGYVFWSWLNREPIYAAAAEHDIEHGLTIIERHAGYADFFHFGTTRNNYISPEELTEKIDSLYQFIAYFRQKCHKIIFQAEESRFILSIPAKQHIHLATMKNQECTTSELFSKSDITRLYLGNEYDNAYLTRREMDILLLMQQGKKGTEVAHELDMSQRTMETHLNHIRDKLKCETLFELGYTLGTLGIDNRYPFKIK